MMTDSLEGRKIAVGLSGGVDSSVAALLLKNAGYDVFAMFMQNWHDITGTLHGECEWEEDLQVAQMVARKIGIPFHFVDLSDEYRHRVVDYMFSEYAHGRTPNPDVMCNSRIKFDAFLKAAQGLGADMVATGHYCRKDSFTAADGRTVYRILAGTDKNKDQSYFLCRLDQEQLSKAVFPIGDMTKPEVREMAGKAGLPSADKKDSQGICFVGKVDLPVFLQQKLASRRGKVVEIFPDFYDALDGYPGYRRSHGDDLLPYTGLALEEVAALSEAYPCRPEDGKTIGEHIGAQYYTIGQRKGLNIGGHREPLFIIHTDIEDNVIYVGEGHFHPGLMRKALRIEAGEVHWIRPDLAMVPGDTMECLVRIRYRQPLQKACLYACDGWLYIVFEEYQRGITPGQFAVWYSDGQEMLGSGVIS